MLEGYRRVILAWVPEVDTDLARFGLEWTGWCPETALRRRPAAFPLPPAIEAARRRLARFGLMAPLCAPLPLGGAPGGWRLTALAATLGERVPPIDVGPLVVTNDGGLRLAPRRQGDLAELRDAVRRVFGPLGGPPRPKPSIGLHLSAPAGEVPASLLTTLARQRLAALLLPPRRITSLALVGDPGGGRPVTVLTRIPLTGPETAEGPRARGIEAFGHSTLVAQPERMALGV